jgi:CRP/FNR family cyclic AMP-dependent transcriptional regulator
MDHATSTRGWAAFERLSPRARERLLPLARPIGCGPGELVFAEGTETPFLGAVDSGRIALRYRVPELGRRLTIATIELGELVGWSALVTPFRATADAVATEPTRLLALDAAPLRDCLAADRELAAELLPIVLETVSRRLTTSWHQLIDLFAARGIGPW